MKKTAIGIIILLIIFGGYIGRHTIKALIAGTQSPTAGTTTTTSQSQIGVPSDNIYLEKTNAAKGNYLTDFQGGTLYTFDTDMNGTSACYDACAITWRPYSSGATAQKTFPTTISVVKRTDGSLQFAWKGKPLYYYSADGKSGDITGDGVGGKWHIITM